MFKARILLTGWSRHCQSLQARDAFLNGNPEGLKKVQTTSYTHQKQKGQKLKILIQVLKTSLYLTLIMFEPLTMAWVLCIPVMNALLM